MIIMQLQSPPNKPLLHPLLHPLLPKPLQQNKRMIMIHIQEPSKPLLHPHPPPQFVAVKSLMLEPPNFLYNVYYE